MAKTNQQIIDAANIIKNETIPLANTAQRIGQQFLDQHEYVQQLVGINLEDYLKKSTAAITIATGTDFETIFSLPEGNYIVDITSEPTHYPAGMKTNDTFVARQYNCIRVGNQTGTEAIIMQSGALTYMVNVFGAVLLSNDDSAAAAVAKTVTKTVAIQPADWSGSITYEDGTKLYFATITDEDIVSTDWIDAHFANVYMKLVSDAGVAPALAVFDNGFSIYAAAIPTAELVLTYKIFGGL